MKLKNFIHPFLFAIFPILFIFAYNIEEVTAIDLVAPILVVLAGTVVLMLLLRLITKSYGKAAIITSLSLLLFFSYGHVRNLLLSAGIVDYVLLFIWIVCFAVGIFLVIKTRKNLSALTTFLNIAIAILVIISLGTIGIHEIGELNHTTEESTEEAKEVSLGRGNPERLPDIYYIILDAYARQDTLQEVFGYDNTEFINYLTGKGFYVANRSESNYDYTTDSLVSSLNMRYLTEEESAIYKTRMNAVYDNEVLRILKGKGYYYVFISGGREYSTDCTDLHLSYKLLGILKHDSIPRLLLETTLLAPFTWYLNDFVDDHSRQSRLFAFDELVNIPYIEAPPFTYSHIVLPHPLYPFDREGNPTTPDMSIFWNPSELMDNEEKYIDQLIFTNKKVMVLVDEIIARSDIAPIIIIQGDHGVWWGDGIVYEILNAYYLPGVEHNLYETISPVNSFRVVFNLYFAADYELLKDESFETGRWDE